MQPKFLKNVQLNKTSKYKREFNSKQPKSLYTRKQNHISQILNASLDLKLTKAKSQKNIYINNDGYCHSGQGHSEHVNSKTQKHMITKKDLKQFIVIGVFEQKIVVCFNNSLQMFGYFDQHAMHQRIRYQYYTDQIKIQNNIFKFSPKRQWNIQIIQKKGKQLKRAIGKKIMCYEKISILENQQLFQKVEQLLVQFIGFRILVQRDHMYLQQYPIILSKIFPLQVYIKIAKQIILNWLQNRIEIPKGLDDIIAESSCKSAYKFNDKIDRNVLEQMIKALSCCDFAFYCVHGRPTFFVK